MWIPWAQVLPTRDELTLVLEHGANDFDADSRWEYSLFRPGSHDIVGGAGVHRTDVPGRYSIGYWVRTSCTGERLATAAARTLSAAVFHHLDDAEQVTIAMDRANLASPAIPPKLSYALAGLEDRDIITEGHTGQELVWSLDRPLVLTASTGTVLSQRARKRSFAA